jgi:hypothetical protein
LAVVGWRLITDKSEVATRLERDVLHNIVLLKHLASGCGGIAQGGQLGFVAGLPLRTVPSCTYAQCGDCLDLAGVAPHQLLVVGPLHQLRLPAQGAGRDSPVDHPVGTAGLQQQAAPVGPVRPVRTQGRHPAASGVAWQRGRVGGVPGRVGVG